METYIKDLKLSPEVKTVLSKGLQITKVSELEGHNYLTLANKCPKEYNATAIANELNELGYLYPPKNEISVYDVSMSKWLQKNLIQNNILYLSQLSINPREKILKFRNMGESTRYTNTFFSRYQKGIWQLSFYCNITYHVLSEWHFPYGRL